MREEPSRGVAANRVREHYASARVPNITRPADSEVLVGGLASAFVDTLGPLDDTGATMSDLEIRRFEKADETRTFEHGSFDLVSVGGMTVGRASYEPGWVWSEHVGRPIGEELCQVEHVGLVVSGRTGGRMADGTEFELTPGDLFSIAPGHDSWVIGDEPYVSLHFLGAGDYAKH